MEQFVASRKNKNVLILKCTKNVSNFKYKVEYFNIYFGLISILVIITQIRCINLFYLRTQPKIEAKEQWSESAKWLMYES